MPPRLNILASCRALALRPRRPAAPPPWQAPRAPALARPYSIDAPTVPPTPPADGQPPGPPPPSATAPPSGAPAPSEPAPVIPLHDLDVALSSLKAGKAITEEKGDEGDIVANEEALRQLERISYGVESFDSAQVGHKYGVPEVPIPSGMHLKHRYHPVLEQITNLLMKDGKKSKAQRDMAMVLNFLRTMPAPKLNPARALLPGAPPASHLPLDPITYLTLAIDSVAPLIKIRNFSGLAGGGASSPVPFPLSIRQRRRVAFQWILELVRKKQSKGSGRTQLAHRIAEEIVGIVEGKSSLWDRRLMVHRLGTTARANIAAVMRRR
ncbi:hypothetical protein RB598_002859 [Gaeumannomyces tritici]